MSSSQSSNPKAPIVVLGAGVIGLTTAVRLLETPLCTQDGHPVHILADHLPDDPLDAYYASTIAGAHHLSFADDADVRQRKWDRRTFEIMAAECAAEGEHATGIMMLKQTETYVGAKTHLAIYEEHPDFRVLDDIPGCDHSISFTSLTMNPPVYLRRLFKRIQSDPLARIHRLHLPSLAAVQSESVKALIGPTPPLALVVCVGIGALTLGGVEDNTVFPTRGQVVKLRAPWVRSGWTRQVGSLQGGEGGERTYVIPRQSGEVIVGGTRENDDWYPYPRPETTTDILRRALEICPEIIPANMNSGSSAAGLAFPEELIEENLVGFRPSRKEGVRLEKGADVGSTAVVYNYGHGGAGWQSCWGTAEDAVSLLLDDTVARHLGNSRL